MPRTQDSPKKRPRTKRSVLTRRKKQVKHSVEPGGDGSPTRVEWQTMARLGVTWVDAYESLDVDFIDSESDDSDSEIICNSEGHKFRVRPTSLRKGDDARVQSPVEGSDEEWLCHIKSIRMRPGDNEPWVRVFWYWSGTDLSGLIKSFDAADCSSYERTYSDHEDFLSALTFISATHVHEYDERDLDPPDLGPTDFFTRAYLTYNKLNIEPKLGFNTCLCKQSYVLFPPEKQDTRPRKRLRRSSTPKYAHSDANGNLTTVANDEQHFCPRETCRRWFHTVCLLKYGHIESSPALYRGDRAVRLLAVDPDSEVNCAVLAWYCDPITEGCDSNNLWDDACRSMAVSSAESVTDLKPASLAEAMEGMSISWTTLAHLPAALVRIAQCPIVRRPGPAQHGWSAVGNVKEVVLARRFVYAALEGCYPGGPGWQHLEALVARVETMASGETDEVLQVGDAACRNDASPGDTVSQWDRGLGVLRNLCIELNDYFLLASPYLPYWEQRGRELDQETWMHSPPLLCPMCKGAI